jgi:hypothetical protein
VRRRAQNVGAPTAPVASAGRSDGGTVAPKDPQYPCWRVLVSRRGLRQDCPLSPYLFVIAINELSIQLQEALHNNNLSGISLGEGAPPIHSLLFAGDLILCGNAIVEEAQAIKTILYDFCQQSGQTPNLQKSSILFSRNVPGNIKNQIKGIFLCPTFNPIPCI